MKNKKQVGGDVVKNRISDFRIRNKATKQLSFYGTQKMYDWIKKQAIKHDTSKTEILRALIDCAMKEK